MSEELLSKIYTARKIEFPKEYVDRWYSEHQKFVAEHGDEIDIRINDGDFSRRREIILEKVKERL